MADQEQMDILAQGVGAWNAWREANPGRAVDLYRARLARMDLRGINLAHADLRHADLTLANLRGARLGFAHLNHARLDGARLRKADLRGAILRHVQAEDARFEGADLSMAHLDRGQFSFACLRRADLHRATLTGANLTGVDLRDARLSGCTYDHDILRDLLRECGYQPRAIWTRRMDFLLDTTLRCAEINTQGCHGSPRIKQFLAAQEHLEELCQTPRGRTMCFLWWISCNCGRSITRWALLLMAVLLIFAGIFTRMGEDHFAVANLPFSVWTMLYYSGVTITTLGFGDIAPRTNLAAWLVLAEVMLGYLLLGGLISIFAGKLSRRG